MDCFRYVGFIPFNLYQGESMKCPKCQHEQIDQNIECAKCGIIFAKFAAAQQTQRKDQHGGSLDSKSKTERSGVSMGDLFFYTRPDSNFLSLMGRGCIFAVLIIWGVKFIASPLEENYAGQSFMHLVNLPFHEVGHIFGLEHCWETGCLMRFSKQLEQLDQLPLHFCSACEYEIARQRRRLLNQD